MRESQIERNTKETQITCELRIEGNGEISVKTPIGFFTHMIEGFSKHGLFDIGLNVEGDMEVDQHHTVEDTGIVLGKAFQKALGDKYGINRSGYFTFPMDDSLAIVAVDIGGRPYLNFRAEFKRRFCGELDTDLIEDFFQGFCVGCGCNIAVEIHFGRNDHHKIEAIFKAFAKAMKIACTKDERAGMPSTKGMIEDDSNN